MVNDVEKLSEEIDELLALCDEYASVDDPTVDGDVDVNGFWVVNGGGGGGGGAQPGFFSFNSIQANNPTFAFHPIEYPQPTSVEFRILESGGVNNRFYIDDEPVDSFVQDPDYLAGKPWTLAPFTKVVSSVRRFIMIFPAGG